MMYPFITLDEDTEITHSELRLDGTVKVYIEKADKSDGFHYATCYLPTYTWEEVVGFTEEEMVQFGKIVKNNAHLIMEFDGKGGFMNASNF